MKRTDAPGATEDFLYTEGDPGSAIPATVVGASEMNNIQEEICQFIESRGIALDGEDFNQLQAAIEDVLLTGPELEAGTFTIANNTAVAANVTPLLFNKDNFLAVEIFIRLSRVSTTENLFEVGSVFLTWDSANSVWLIEMNTHFEDAGVTLTITSGGQVKYTSTNMGGASYVGTLKYSVRSKIKA